MLTSKKEAANSVKHNQTYLVGAGLGRAGGAPQFG